MKPSKTRVGQVALTSGLLALALGLAPVVGGCGDEQGGEPTSTSDETAAPATAAAPAEPPARMDGDMVATPAPTRAGAVARVQSALSSGDGDGSSGAVKAGEPNVIYLIYADGQDDSLPSDANACVGTAPKFNCTFAPTLAECQRQIQTYLDKWYADFNVIFTLTRPLSGRYYTEVVSSGGGAWCNVSSKVAGVAPFLCSDLQGGVSYTFLGGTSAKQTAIIIAQEQAHLVGLEHTTSTKDLMYPSICTDCDGGFQDEELAIDGDRCDRTTQNSYQMMKDRLGLWPGGPKPSAFGCMNDQRPPTLEIMEPVDGAKVKADFTLRVNASDDCDLASVQVSVMPQSLKATSYAPPYQWDLTNIGGQQTLTVTAIDGSGHVTQKSVTVTAPMAIGTMNSTVPGGMAGCTVGSGAFGIAGLLPALGALVVFSRRRRSPTRRRAVTGALRAEPPAAPPTP